MAIKKGNKIKVEYEGKFENGEIFDSSKHGDHDHPLEFVVGSGQVIKGFDKAVLGMKKGEEKEFSVESGDAYGERNEKLIQEVPKNALPKEQDPKQGMILIIGTPDGHKFPAKIVEINNDKIKLDLNHPLAGKKLFFKIKIIDIQEGEKAENPKKRGEKSLEDLA